MDATESKNKEKTRSGESRRTNKQTATQTNHRRNATRERTKGERERTSSNVRRAAQKNHLK